MFSIVIFTGDDNMKYMYKIQFCCILVRSVFEDRERDMCVFSWRLQRHPTTTSLTRTHTHTHDGPTVDARSSGSRFSGFCNFNFDPVRSAIF